MLFHCTRPGAGRRDRRPDQKPGRVEAETAGRRRFGHSIWSREADGVSPGHCHLAGAASGTERHNPGNSGEQRRAAASGRTVLALSAGPRWSRRQRVDKATTFFDQNRPNAQYLAQSQLIAVDVNTYGATKKAEHTNLFLRLARLPVPPQPQICLLSRREITRVISLRRQPRP